MVDRRTFPHSLNSWAWMPSAKGSSIINTRPCSCNTAYNSIPIHLENTKFPTVGPQALNLSTRGMVSDGDNVVIGGFIITGTEPKTLVLRALGPSLSGFGLSDVLSGSGSQRV